MNAKSWIPVVSLAFALAACAEKRSASVELSGLNYTDIGIAGFSVEGFKGHSIFPNGGGGAFVCCVTIPRRWHAGMKVTVRWVKDAHAPGPWMERAVEVPRYTEQDIGIFAVHFYSDDTVKVLVTSKIVGHPDYPYPRPKS